jgi:hypothetical protein
MIDHALTSLLIEHAGCDNRVYTGGDRVEVLRDLPKVLYTQVSLVRPYCDDGSIGLVKARFQIDIFAATPPAARAIADNIRIGLDGFAGTVGSSLDPVKILRIYFDDEQMGKADGVVGQPRTAARWVQEMIIDYVERLASV